jgi:hypothetical protein
MNGLPRLYTARMDVDPSFLPRFAAWYEARHAPDLINAGFYSTQAYYSAVGTPLVCNIYEIPGAELFLCPAYQDARARDPQRAEVLERISNRSNSVYEQVVTAARAAGPVGPVRSPWVTTLRLDVPPAAAADLTAWYEGTEFPRLRARASFVSGRLGRQDGRHPTAPCEDPPWALFVEWADEPSAREGGPGLLPALQARFAGALEATQYNLVHRVFGLYAREGR